MVPLQEPKMAKTLEQTSQYYVKLLFRYILNYIYIQMQILK